MQTIRAIYDNGVFRPLGPVNLPEGALVEFEVAMVREPGAGSMDEIYRILDKRYDTGDRDAAARIDEHQP